MYIKQEVWDDINVKAERWNIAKDCAAYYILKFSVKLEEMGLAWSAMHVTSAVPKQSIYRTQHAVSNHYLHTSNISINHELHSSIMHRQLAPVHTNKQTNKTQTQNLFHSNVIMKNQQNHQMIPFQSFILINCHTFCYKQI